MKPFRLFIQNVEYSISQLSEGHSDDFKQRSIEKQQEIKSNQERIRSEYDERSKALKKGRKNKHHGSLVVGLVKLGAKSALKSAKNSLKKSLKKKKS